MAGKLVNDVICIMKITLHFKFYSVCCRVNEFKLENFQLWTYQQFLYYTLNCNVFYYHLVVTIAATKSHEKGKSLSGDCLSGCSAVIETIFSFQS